MKICVQKPFFLICWLTLMESKPHKTKEFLTGTKEGIEKVFIRRL